MSIQTKTLFQITVALGAFLLFLVQPLLGKYLLPRFGGSFSVWSAAISFFTSALFIGYAYAYSVTNLKEKAGKIIQTIVILIGIFSIIIGAFFWDCPLLPKGFDLSFLSPFSAVFFLLFLSVGIPYIILSATSVVLQNFQAKQKENVGPNPYSLYALSNAASFLALILYPLIFEPFISTSLLSTLWSIGFLLYAILMIVCIFRSQQEEKSVPKEEEESVGILRIAKWIIYAGLGTWLLVSMTSYMTQGISGLPLLAILPLALYLLSFVLSFAGAPFLPFFLYPLFASTLPLFSGGSLSWLLVAISGSLFMLLACLFLHAKLYELRPTNTKLSLFYLVIAGAGAVGSILASLGAPFILNGLYELHIGFIALIILLIPTIKILVKEIFSYARPMKFVILFFLVSIGATLFTTLSQNFDQNLLYKARTFYGIYQVTEGEYEGNLFRTLISGSILHGSQFKEKSKEFVPTSYYSNKSAIGIILSASSTLPRKVGLIGLGAGTLASYCNKGDVYRFYEIDEEVISIAKKYFTFLSRCEEMGGKLSVIVGDARLSLEKEGGDPFDVLVIDAFTDDAIPAHLLTIEAFKLYKKHIKENGIIAVHVSNRYLDLTPVVASAANTLKLQAIAYKHVPEENEVGATVSAWVLVGNNATLNTLFPDINPETGKEYSPWSDNKHSLLPALIEGFSN